MRTWYAFDADRAKSLVNLQCLFTCTPTRTTNRDGKRDYLTHFQVARLHPYLTNGPCSSSGRSIVPGGAPPVETRPL